MCCHVSCAQPWYARAPAPASEAAPGRGSGSAASTSGAHGTTLPLEAGPGQQQQLAGKRKHKRGRGDKDAPAGDDSDSRARRKDQRRHGESKGSKRSKDGKADKPGPSRIEALRAERMRRELEERERARAVLVGVNDGGIGCDTTPRVHIRRLARAGLPASGKRSTYARALC